jgi:hypothetical protein
VADKNTALATVEGTQFLTLQSDSNETIARIQDVFGEEGLSLRDMERIRLPAAGGKFWSLKDIDGEDKASPTFEGIILTQRQVRTFWLGSFDETGGGKPPDCYSDDAVHGIGTPGIECARCPHAQFSSGKGKSQACQLKRLMFFLLPDTRFPAYVALPPTSQAEGKSYLYQLMNRDIMPYEVVTEFGLAAAKSDAGIAYSKVTLKRKRGLSPEEKDKIRAVAPLLIKAINAARIQAVDVDGSGDDDDTVNSALNGKYVDAEVEEI